MHFIMRQITFDITALVVTLMVLVGYSSSQSCSPANNSEGMIIPNTDLPTTGVRLYLQQAEEPIPNFLMLHANQIQSTGSPTGALWCQSANSDTHNGTWFQPPGSIPPGYTVVPSEDIDGLSSPYQMVTCSGQVGLLRDSNVITHQGLLQCAIHDEQNITHTLTAGVFSGAVYDNYTGPVVDSSMQFTLLSTRDIDPPQFTLRFNSSYGPPTAVECEVDGNTLNGYIVSRRVKCLHFTIKGDLDSVNASSPDTLDVTEVTVTVNVRQGGVYQCNVTVLGRNVSLPQQVVTLGTGDSTANIKVLGAPQNVIVTRTSIVSTVVSWVAPSPAPAGYEVFYRATIPSSSTPISGGNTSNTELTLTGLSLETTYSIFVVAFGDNYTLPSPRSVPVSLLPDAYIFPAHFGINIEGASKNSLVFSVSVKRSTETFNMTVQDSSSVIKNSTKVDMPVTGNYYSVIFKFDTLRLSDAGQYTCLVVVTDGNNNTAIIKGTYTVIVRLATLNMSLDNLGSTVLAGTKRSIICSVIDHPSVMSGIFLSSLLITYQLFDLNVQEYIPIEIMNTSQVTVHNILEGIARLDFNSIRSSDGGEYEYVAQATNKGIFVSLSGFITINVIISITNVTVTSTNDSLSQGMVTDIVCNTTISEAVNTPYTIKYQWFGPSLLTNGPDYTITNDTLHINQLSTARDSNRIITCVTTVIPTPGQRYVLQNNASESIQLSVELGYCSHETTDEGTKGTFQWTKTAVNDIATAACYYGPTDEMATRLCVSLDTWAAPSVAACRTVVSEQFNMIVMVNISNQNVDSVIKNITSVVASANQTSDQNADNLKVVANVLTQSVEVIQTGNVSLKVANEAVTNAAEILDNVEEWPTEIVEQQSNQIVKAFDSIVDALIQQENFTNISVVQRDLALKGERLERATFHGRTLSAKITESHKLDLSTPDVLERLTSHENTQMFLPQAVADTIAGEQHVTMAFTVYNSPVLFPVRNASQGVNSSTTVVGSQVVSATVNGIKNGARLTAGSQVTFSLRLTNVPTLGEEEFVSNRRCVFWDFAGAGGNGNWSSYGCSLVSFNSSTNVVKCECNHLTNFACLVDISVRLRSDENENKNTTAIVFPREFDLALNITSYIGVLLSLGGLTVFLLTHLIFKTFRQRDVAKFHIQLALSMLLMLIVFVAGISRTENRAGCITVSVLLHYLILVTWMWMGAEAVLLFQKLIIVFKHFTTFQLLFISVICWAVPLLPVVVSVAVSPNHYITQSNTSRDFCFIGDAGVFFGAFLAPIFLVIIANACVAVCAGYVIIKHSLIKQQDMKQAASMKKQRMSSKEAWKLLISLIGFMILLGLSWVILLFTVVGADTNIYAAFAIQWLFVFFNSLQGFFIFIFFVMISPDIRNHWKTLLTAPCSKNNKYSHRYNRTLRSTTSGTLMRSSKGTIREAVNRANKKEKLLEDTSVNDNLTINCENTYVMQTDIMKTDSSKIEDENEKKTVM